MVCAASYALAAGTAEVVVSCANIFLVYDEEGIELQHPGCMDLASMQGVLLRTRG